MTNFYGLSFGLKRSCIEILPNLKIQGDFLHFFLEASLPQSTNRLPDDIVFHIKACKKEFDIIGVYNCMTSNYYSKELMDILQQFTDMSDRSYKINLPDATKEYYAIYNLKKYPLINRKELELTIYDSPIRFILGKPDLGPVFSVSTTAYIVVSEDIMKALKKAKITNVEYVEMYGYTPEEALEWARENPDSADDFADTDWFKELLLK